MLIRGFGVPPFFWVSPVFVVPALMSLGDIQLLSEKAHNRQEMGSGEAVMPMDYEYVAIPDSAIPRASMPMCQHMLGHLCQRNQ